MRTEKDIPELSPDSEFYVTAPRLFRSCKAIVPRDEKAAEGTFATENYPRIVSSKFKVPGNWKVVEGYKDGEPIMADPNGSEPLYDYDYSKRPLRRRKLFHTCKKPYEECHRGFWGKSGPWEEIPSAK